MLVDNWGVKICAKIKKGKETCTPFYIQSGTYNVHVVSNKANVLHPSISKKPNDQKQIEPNDTGVL